MLSLTCVSEYETVKVYAGASLSQDFCHLELLFQFLKFRLYVLLAYETRFRNLNLKLFTAETAVFRFCAVVFSTFCASCHKLLNVFFRCQFVDFSDGSFVGFAGDLDSVSPLESPHGKSGVCAIVTVSGALEIALAYEELLHLAHILALVSGIEGLNSNEVLDFLLGCWSLRLLHHRSYHFVVYPTVRNK